MRNLPRLPLIGVSLSLAWAAAASAAAAPVHNVILFVADGLRSGAVTPETAPTMSALRRQGVDFRNSHALFPTLTTANASAFATGHGLGDTGDFANSIYVGSPMKALGGSPIAIMENDAVLTELAARYGGSYLNEETVLAAAAGAGYSTAAVGKLGPVLIQALGAAPSTSVIDDETGSPAGPPVEPALAEAILDAGLAFPAPSRGANAATGTFETPGTLSANVDQGAWFAHVASRVLLPRFKKAGRPFVMVFWSRDPDGTQHNQGDSLGAVTPGINGPTSRAGIRNADDALAELLAKLKALGLDRTTDVIVVADHGFSTISRESRTSPSAKVSYSDVRKGQLPPGFLAIDLSEALRLPLNDAKGRPVLWREGRHAAWGDALLGDPAHPRVVVDANGGSDLIYLPDPNGRAALAAQVVRALWSQDYTGAVFVKDELGPIPGTLPLSAVGLIGSALTPTPDVVVSFRSFSTGCAQPELCAVDVADTSLQQGQGMHGSLSRANTHNFMAAIGPDFRSGFIDPAPASNADLAQTMAQILHLMPHQHGRLGGRILTESLKGGAPVAFSRLSLQSPEGPAGLTETIVEQRVGRETYYDAAGAPGRAVGLSR